MALDTSAFRVPSGGSVDLARLPTRVEPLYRSQRDHDEQLARQVARLSERQTLLYAHDRYALLLVFQAMDAAGKDSVIKHVMSGVNPQGCQVYSFKHPSAQELDHDFLWRSTLCLPERGRIGIFNRSYYEEVLVVKVHGELLAAEALPQEATNSPDLWQHRYDSINDFERHLHRNGTRVVKFFLHLSKQEQARRFLARLDEPDKNWKFSAADVTEREHWDRYMSAYGDCLAATSTEHAPWYCVPADDKANTRLIVSQVLTDTIDALRMQWPKPALGPDELQALRQRLDGNDNPPKSRDKGRKDGARREDGRKHLKRRDER